MLGFILLGLLSAGQAQTPSDGLVISIDPNSDKVTSIIAACGLKRVKKPVSDGKVVFTALPSGVCNLKFNPSGGSFRNVEVGSKLDCRVSNGMNVRCLSLEEVVKREEDLKKKETAVNKRAITEKKKDIDLPSDQLMVEILPTSEKVLSINITCGDYRKKGVVEGNRVIFTDIPSETCNLKFNPGGGSMRNMAVGSRIQCSVVNGNRVSCN